ncbi:MAG: MarR family winged helix-turn-helix transcriptional regulator, partial [Dehalococcoidia bacterium]
MNNGDSNGADLFATWTLMHQAYLLTYKYLDQIVSRLGISQAQASVLLVLRGAGEPLALSKLARFLVQEAQSVTSLVDRLESRGYVRRVPDSRDRRVIHVELTADGEEMFNQIFPAAWKGCREVFIDLSKKELTELGQLATKVRDRSADLLGLDRAPYERARETLQFTPDLF